MRIRSLVLSSFVVAAWCFAPSAHAAGTGGSGGHAGTGGAGTGGAGDPGCTVSAEQQSGTMCLVCDTTIGLCSEQYGSSYNFVCKSSASAEVWCNGPARAQSSDTTVACAVKAPGARHDDAASLCVLAAAALAVGLRRRRR